MALEEIRGETTDRLAGLEQAINQLKVEYAAASIPRYWTVDCDPAQTVTMHELVGNFYAARTVMPLEWVLNSRPADHLG